MGEFRCIAPHEPKVPCLRFANAAIQLGNDRNHCSDQEGTVRLQRISTPTDDSRLSAVKAIDDISSCLGTVVPLLSTQFGDAEVHNIRAAFVAGLSVAMGKLTLVLQPRDGPGPARCSRLGEYL